MLTLGQAIELFSDQVGQGRDPGKEINLVCAKLVREQDCYGSYELVAFTVTADADGQGFITLPVRYIDIRGAVETSVANSVCAIPLPIRNNWYEFTIGNLGMLKGSNPMEGIIPITMSEGDTQRRFKVPVCPTPGSLAYFYCICKRDFLFMENDDDVLPVWSEDAIERGLNARKKMYAEDYAREGQLWDQSSKSLAAHTANVTGSQALGKVQIDDDYLVGDLGGMEGWGGNYGGGWY